MWWLWVYWPRKMVARLGQHRELVTNAFSKVVPVSINACKLGMCFSVSAFTSSKARSSVRIKTTFGGLDFSFSSLEAAPIGKQIFAHGISQRDPTAFWLVLDTYATRLLAQALRSSLTPGVFPECVEGTLHHYLRG